MSASTSQCLSACGARQCQLEWRIAHDVRSGSQEDQPGAESAMAKAKGHAPKPKNDLSGGPQENCRGAAGTVGEVEGNHLGGRTKADRDAQKAR